MATNQVYDEGDQLSVVCTDPASPNSGDPVLFGTLGGVALTKKGDGGNASTNTSVAFEGVFTLSVKGVNGSGNAAIAAGDTVYYVTGDTPKLSAKTTGVKFGVALAAVASGATTAIMVRLNGSS